MKTLIKHFLFRPFYVKRDGIFHISESNRRFLTKVLYRIHMGKTLNLNNPNDLNEKVLWLKLYSDTSRWVELADKYKVREYVKECGLSDILIDLYAVYNNPKEIDLTNLPNKFVLKLNNGSGTVLVVKDKNSVNKNKLFSLFNKWYKIPFGMYTEELHYLHIKPLIIAEKYLEEKSNISSSPIDYKFYCINGKVSYVMVCYDRIIREHSVKLIYDLEWNYRNDLMRVSVDNPHLPEPINFDRMIRIAEQLSKPFPFVRVDLYNIDGVIYFGEMTFTPMAGWSKVMNQELLNNLGAKINISL